MGTWDSATTIINDAAIELGIGIPGLQPAGADPWSSLDQNIIKLVGYLKSGGREVVREREWQSLTVEATLLTVAGQEAYATPPDFRSVSDRTGWDRTNRFPLGGPLDGVEWQYLKGILAGNPIQLYFRVKGSQILVAGGASVPGGRTVAYEYASSYWAGPAGSLLPGGNTKEFPTAKDDIVFLDPAMMVKRLKHDFASNNGMGDVFKMDYKKALEQAQNSDSQMPALRLSARRGSGLLSSRNLPPTGWS